MSKNENNNFFKSKKFITIIALVAIILIVCFTIFNGKTDSITKVKKVSSPNNYEVKCIGSDCNYIYAYSGDKQKKYNVTIYNSKGKKVANFYEKYDEKSSVNKIISQATNKYFIYKKVNKKNNKVSSYSIVSKYGKQQYSTKNELSVLTDNLILMKEIKGEETLYTILDKNGKNIYTNITDYKTYLNEEILYFVQNNQNVIILPKNNGTIYDYTIDDEITNKDGKVLYLILKDSNKNSFYYFNIKKYKIVGDSFQNYIKTDVDGELTITKNENDKLVQYTLTSKGKQKKKENSFSQNDVISSIKKQIDTQKYYIYTNSIVSSDQNYVFVDDVKNKKFGIYDLKKNKFKELYSYKTEGVFTSNVYNLNNIETDAYFQIVCSQNYCDNSKLLIYDLKKNQKLYELNDDTLRAQRYTQYSDGYKVIKFASSSSNTEFGGKYVLYDKKDKVLYSSTNVITLVDKELLFGKTSSSSLILYSAKKSKVLNDDSSLAKVITVSDSKYYTYSNEDNTYLIDNTGKEILSISSNVNFVYSNEAIIYIDNNKINILNVTNNKIKNYKLKNNEKINDESGNVIAPYRNSMFINNTNDDYFKVININGNIIKTIKIQEISFVSQSSDSKNVFIITKKIKNNNNYYGIYLAK